MDRTSFLTVFYVLLCGFYAVSIFSGGSMYESAHAFMWVVAIGQLLFIPQYITNREAIAGELPEGVLDKQLKVYAIGGLTVFVLNCLAMEGVLAIMMGLTTMTILYNMNKISRGKTWQ
jgi:hypothetical protein